MELSDAETTDRLTIIKRIRENNNKILLFFNTYPPLNEFQQLFLQSSENLQNSNL